MADSLEEILEATKSFGLIDYAVFVFMLSICSVVGLYFGYQDHRKRKAKQQTGSRRGSFAHEYLLGGQNIQIFPVAMSMVATAICGVTLLGTSTEIYIYGIQYAYILAGPTIMGFFIHLVVIPVFYDLKVVSMYEYLEKRFDMKMRLFGSLVSSLSTVVYLPIILYVPALAFNQVAGVDVHIITPIVMAVCVFYTCLGGIKAVIWTDVIQIVIMFGVMILIIVKGTANVGGLSVVLERNWNGDRLEAPDFRTDPTIRHTFWTLFVGGSFYYIIAHTDQNFVQRFLTLKNKKSARNATVIYIASITLFIGICIYNGLVLYATYYDCDPLTTKLATVNDQLVPLLVMQTFRDFPGLPGLFIAGVFSATLSSVSSALNVLAAVVHEDYFKPFMKDGMSERFSSCVMRGTVLLVGTSSVVLVHVVQKLGTILQLAMSVPATCIGSLFGVFALGMFAPWIGKRAAFTGVLIGSSVMIYIVIRSQLDITSGALRYETKVTSVEGCTFNFTSTVASPSNEPISSKEFHHVSYLYYMPLGALITSMSAFIMSFLFGFEDPSNVNPKLLAPFMRKYFNSKIFKEVAENADEGMRETTFIIDNKEDSLQE